jgi:hypothetical protein
MALCCRLSAIRRFRKARSSSITPKCPHSIFQSYVTQLLKFSIIDLQNSALYLFCNSSHSSYRHLGWTFYILTLVLFCTPTWSWKWNWKHYYSDLFSINFPVKLEVIIILQSVNSYFQHNLSRIINPNFSFNKKLISANDNYNISKCFSIALCLPIQTNVYLVLRLLLLEIKVRYGIPNFHP